MRRLVLVQADAARRERASELLPPVVQGLVKSAARRLEPLGEDVDRHLVQRERYDHLALMWAQVLLDRLAQRGELIRRLDCLLSGALVIIGDQGPRLGGEWDLTSLPGVLAHLGRSLIQRKLVRPRRKAAFAPELIELPQDHHKRVVRTLVGEVIEVPTAQSARRRSSAYLKAGRPQQQRVQLDERGIALRTRGS
ncbi:MAG TPA: hypothetical protein VN672_10010 [Solirubrobacteraceae bacterium]|nr:hypothetical protein [Solirubrobacteraceae bacterium]